jgi:hypothetical protein
MAFFKKKVLERKTIIQITLIILTFTILSQINVYRLNQVNSNPARIMHTPLLGRYGHSMVYNPENGKIIMFGGFNFDEDNELDDMWEYDCATDVWKELHQSEKPPATSGHGMVFDSINRKFILFGGYNAYGRSDKTWIYDHENNSWTEMLPQVKPSPRDGRSMYFDPVIGETVLFGGYSDQAVGADETWTYNYVNNTWTFHDLITKPPARYGPKIVYDPVNQRGVLFGGRIIGENTLNGTWEFDSSTMSWAKLNITESPSARYWYCMDYDPVNKVMILFGGSEGNVPFSQETWVFNVTSNQWLKMNPESNPPNRSFHNCAFDSESGKIVMFGGTQSGYLSPYNDTWSYSYDDNAWIDVDYQVVEFLTTSTASTTLTTSTASGFDSGIIFVTLFVLLTFYRKKK